MALPSLLVNPARAGMILRVPVSLFPSIGKPRASGDDPTLSVAVNELVT
mgnify:CR=1 FL=1